MEVGGTYVLLEDVVNSIRQYAQSLTDPAAGAAIHELASWLGASDMPAATAGITTTTVPHSMEDLSVAQDLAVYRVEIYPEPPDDPRPKWYARSVDSEGTILWTSGGAFDFDYVHHEASERWPGKPIFKVNRWADDTVFVENQERNAYPTAAPMRERVSPKRMFA